MPEAKPSAEFLAAERWFAEHQVELERYRGEYVAVDERGLVDHDADLTALTERVWAKGGYRPLLTPRIGDEARKKLRSPRRPR
jgi:hypothetical protein